MSTGVGKALVNASADDAQLILSLLVWPKECPDPRVVDAWLRRQGAGWLPERHDVRGSHQVGPAPHEG